MSSEQAQIKSRERVRELAEVYTHEREVNAMLDLVADMFPSEGDPDNIDRTFLEPSCGSGNFLVEILRRKLTAVTVRAVGGGEEFEYRVLRCLASIYAIDINQENVDQSRQRMRSVIESHLASEGASTLSPALASAIDVVLATNVIRADALADAGEIELVQYRPTDNGMFLREWSSLDAETRPLDLFSPAAPQRDDHPVHYSQLATHPAPTVATDPSRKAA